MLLFLICIQYNDYRYTTSLYDAVVIELNVIIAASIT